MACQPRPPCFPWKVSRRSIGWAKSMCTRCAASRSISRRASLSCCSDHPAVASRPCSTLLVVSTHRPAGGCSIATGSSPTPMKPEDALALVNLTPRQDHFPSQLSGGEQQRVAIARAIAKRPDVLLCDEPTGALDINTGVVVLEAIARVNEELGTTTVVITHNAAVADMADRVISLADGHIVQERRNERRLPASDLRW